MSPVYDYKSRFQIVSNGSQYGIIKYRFKMKYCISGSRIIHVEFFHEDKLPYPVPPVK